MLVPFKNIPTFDFQTKSWSSTTFPDQPAFADFLWSLFKEPGEYEFDESIFEWNKLAVYWEKHKYYTELPQGTKDWREFWDFEKKKNRLGVIWKNGDKTWYTPRCYYMLINFLPITNKEKDSRETFCDVRDVQYHMALYEKIAQATHKFSPILKKRQMLSSYYHCAKLINIFWFEKHKRLKMLASDDAFVSGEQGSWMILDQYKDFLNANTPWYRNCEPTEVGNWQQKIKVKIKGKWQTKGNRSTIVSRTLKRDPKKGVGGPGYINFYEEGGIAPTADKTLEYLNPAMESGLVKTGDFVIAGSVGDLKECKPLEAFMKDPEIYGMLAVPTKWYDDTGVIKLCGLFIPEQYGMPPFIDPFGNSMVKEALEALTIAEVEWKKLPADLYQLKKSQKPKTIQEAFDFREALFFPTQLIQRRQQIIKEQIKEGHLKPKKGIMDEDKDGNPVFVPLESLSAAERPAEMEFPVDPKQVDKRGVTIIYQSPQKDLELGMNFAGVDSIEANITTTSNSLFSVSIVSRIVEVHHTDKDGKQTVSYEGGKLMACWTGRYDDINDTNRQGELLIRLYRALSACERNKPNFINHMRRKGHSKLILRRKELTLFKDVDMTGYDTDEWGVYLGSDGKANDIINGNLLEDLTTELDAVHKKNKDGSIGEVVKTIRGLDLIDDYWTLEELKLYHKDVNTDRRISFGLAKTAAKCYELSYKKKVYKTDQPPKKQPAKQFGFNLLHQPYRGKPRSMLG